MSKTSENFCLTKLNSNQVFGDVKVAKSAILERIKEINDLEEYEGNSRVMLALKHVRRFTF